MLDARPNVILFDIDGTLITAHGAGGRAFTRALRDEVGPDAELTLTFAGGTDRGIARQGLEGAGVEASEEVVDRVLTTYIEYLLEAMKDTSKYTVFSGVVEMLDELHGRQGFAIGLGTGNIERGARIKLAPAQLNGYFDFGGFGCDAEDRADLIRIGATRGATRLGAEFEQCRVLVIGDTTRDVAAAQAIGAECLGVTTGGASRDELMDCGATACVNDLTDPSALRLVLGE